VLHRREQDECTSDQVLGGQVAELRIPFAAATGRIALGPDLCEVFPEEDEDHSGLVAHRIQQRGPHLFGVV
jgi:hypothetical protein